MPIRHNALQSTPELKEWIATQLQDEERSLENITAIVIRAYDNGASDMAAMARKALEDDLGG